MKYRKPSHKTLGSYLCLRYLLYYLYVFIIVCFQSDLPCSPPGDLPNPVIVSRSHSLQVASLPSELALYCKIQTYIEESRENTRPFSYDLNLIPYNYTVEVTNRLKGLSDTECLKNCGWGFITLYRRQ